MPFLKPLVGRRRAGTGAGGCKSHRGTLTDNDRGNSIDAYSRSYRRDNTWRKGIGRDNGIGGADGIGSHHHRDNITVHQGITGIGNTGAGNVDAVFLPLVRGRCARVIRRSGNSYRLSLAKRSRRRCNGNGRVDCGYNVNRFWQRKKRRRLHKLLHLRCRCRCQQKSGCWYRW